VIRALPKRVLRRKKPPTEATSWIIIHLGTNPVKGGSPPKDKREIKVRSFKGDRWFVWLTRWEM